MKDQTSEGAATYRDIACGVAYDTVHAAETQPGASPGDIHAELPYLFAVARRLTGNPQDAHDVVQDALVRALPALPTIVPGSHLRAWLVTIVRHVHIDRIRRAAREPASVPIDDSLAESLPCREPEPPPDDAVGIEDVEAALSTLPEAFRRVFVLHALEGRPYREIAVTLDIPLATVGTRLNRARTKLRALLVDRRAAARPSRPLHAAGRSHAERALLGATGSRSAAPASRAAEGGR